MGPRAGLPALLASVLLLSFLPGAVRAGDAANPEITDAPNDAGPAAAWGDIIAGWFNETATDLTGTLVMSQLAASPPAGTSSYIIFDPGTPGGSLGFGLFVGPDNQPTFFYAHWDAQNGPTDFTTGQGSITTGAPGSTGSISFQMPLTFLNNGTVVRTLKSVVAGTGQLTPLAFVPAPLPLPGSVFFVDTDGATGKDYTMATAGGAAGAANGTTPGGSPIAAPGGGTSNGTGNGTGPAPSEAPAKTPAVEAPFVVLGVAIVALVARRRS